MSIKDSTYRLPFDQYQRYRLVAEIIQVLEGDSDPFNVIEVGGYPPKMQDFLPGREITVADRVEADHPGYITAEATDLPFPDNSFGVAVSLDTLEHIAPDKRELFISELCRVARGYVIIAAPFASDAVKAADRAVFEFIRAHAGYEQKFLKEHIDLELPDLVNTLAQMADLDLDAQVLPSGRLDRWLFMMAAYYTLDADPDLKSALPSLMEAYNRAYYDFDKAEPAYRHFLVGAYEGLGKRWGLLAGLATGDSVEAIDDRGVSMVLGLAGAIGLRKKDKELEALSTRLNAKDEEIIALKEYVTELEDFMNKVKSMPLYSLYEKFIKPIKKL
jgi:hypothetical protein